MLGIEVVGPEGVEGDQDDGRPGGFGVAEVVGKGGCRLQAGEGDGGEGEGGVGDGDGGEGEGGGGEGDGGEGDGSGEPITAPKLQLTPTVYAPSLLLSPSTIST